MDVIIRLGENPSEESITYFPTFLDDTNASIQEMTTLLQANNLTIYNANHFLIYQAGVMMLRHTVSQYSDTPKEIKDLPNINPRLCKIIQVNEHGVERCVQEGEDGLLSLNYFDDLMKKVMDSYYQAINYYY